MSRVGQTLVGEALCEALAVEVAADDDGVRAAASVLHHGLKLLPTLAVAEAQQRPEVDGGSKGLCVGSWPGLGYSLTMSRFGTPR